MGARRMLALLVTVTMAAAACGGGDDDSAGGGDAGNPFEAVGDAADDAESGASSFEVLDEPTVTADPGAAVVEVDGQRFEYQLIGSINPTCDIAPDYVQVNIQSADGYSMSLVVSMLTGSWTGSLTAVGEDTNIAYGSTFGGGRVGIGDNSVSYEGPIDKVVDRDIMNPETMNGTVAVNCDTPGGDPTATVGDQTFTFPLSGAQSVQCEIGPDTFEVRVNRLALDNLQLEMQGRNDGTQWVGAVVVYTADGNWTGQLQPDGTGLSIDGTTVSFDGTFTGPDGSEAQGSALATCS